MPRGVRFCPIERQVASRAYRTASDNSIKGADQKLSMFDADVWRNVKKFQPPGVHEGKFSERSGANIVRLCKSSILNDIQKFSMAVRLVRAANPTGKVSKKDIECMAIANHCIKRVGLNYNYTTFGDDAFDPITMWSNIYAAWLELKSCPKYMESPSNKIASTHEAKTNRSCNVTGLVASYCLLLLLLRTVNYRKIKSKQ